MQQQHFGNVFALYNIKYVSWTSLDIDKDQTTPKRAETGLILLVYAGEFEIKTQNSDKNLL